MNKAEFADAIGKVDILNDVVAEVEQKYKTDLTAELKRILSLAPDGAFIDEWRLLSSRAILNASKELGVDFVKARFIPIFDVMDGDYIVYHINTDSWSMFNVPDNLVFREDASLSNLLEA